MQKSQDWVNKIPKWLFLLLNSQVCEMCHFVSLGFATTKIFSTSTKILLDVVLISKTNKTRKKLSLSETHKFQQFDVPIYMNSHNFAEQSLNKNKIFILSPKNPKIFQNCQNRFQKSQNLSPKIFTKKSQEKPDWPSKFQSSWNKFPKLATMKTIYFLIEQQAKAVEQ